ncbi:MAG: hypothetical protein EBU90_04045, partial [Proteobacteria bacterium]|nr:hypothetical protein [Pseudomonadota bacterium]
LVRTDEQKTKDNRGGHNRETIMLNIDTFKNLCMMAKTEKGKEIRKYYVKLENIYNQIIKEEIEENKTQLEEQQKKLQFYEHKPQTNGFLARRAGYVYMIKDRSKPGHYKIGMAHNPDKRLRNLNTSSSEKSLKIYHEIESYDCELLEKTVHGILKPFNVNGRKEWFYLNEKDVKYALHVLYTTHEFLNQYNHTSSEDYSDFFDHHKEQQLQQILDQLEQNDTHTDNQQEPTNPITETNIYKLTGQQLKNKTGTYKGVFWSRDKNKWRAALKMHYNEVFLGYFDTEVDGAKAYNDYALYINQTQNTNYTLNVIPDYTPVARNVPEENKAQVQERTTSQYNGVSYDDKRKYYVVSIKYKTKTYHLGNHTDPIECAKLYNQQALYYNTCFNTNYVLNDIPNYTTIANNIFEQIQNQKSSRKTSKYYGVTFSKQNNKYRAVVVHNKKQLHLGFFENEVDAARSYNDKARELNREYNKQYKINLID